MTVVGRELCFFFFSFTIPCVDCVLELCDGVQEMCSAFLRYFYFNLLDKLQLLNTKNQNPISMAVLMWRGGCSAMFVYTCVCVWGGGSCA